MVTSTLRSLIPGQALATADLGVLAQVVKGQLAAHRAGLPLVTPGGDIPMNYRVWGLQFGRQDNTVLTSTRAIADLFQRDGIDGRLLILGEAGVGKTHTLLAVGELLLRRGGPVPVLLDVSAWAGETMREWLITTLWREYRVAQGVASRWIDTAQLTLLVDGFDHLDTPQKRQFLAALEALLRGNPEQTALLCCRRQVIEESGLTFDQFNAGIHIIPMAAQQVKDYVMGQNRPELWPVIKGSKVLQQLARLPLCLSLLLALTKLPNPPIRDRADLVQRYLDQCLAKAPGNRVQHRASLGWLAEQLGQRTRLFQLDDLDRSWLPSSRQLLYRLLLGLAIALLMGLVGGNLLLGLALGLMMSQIDLEQFAYLRRGVAIASLGRLTQLGLICGLVGIGVGLGVGSLAALGLGFFGWGVAAFGWAGAGGVLAGWSLSLLALLRGGMQVPIQTRQVPNQDVVLGLRNTTVLVAILGVVLALFLILPAVVSDQPALLLLPPDRLRLVVAVLISAVLWLSFGLQQSLVRSLLGGRWGLPLAARPWLDAMVKAGLLRRLGGGYSFGHEMLRQAMLRVQGGADR